MMTYRYHAHDVKENFKPNFWKILPELMLCGFVHMSPFACAGLLRHVRAEEVKEMGQGDGVSSSPKSLVYRHDVKTNLKKTL